MIYAIRNLNNEFDSSRALMLPDRRLGTGGAEAVKFIDQPVELREHIKENIRIDKSFLRFNLAPLQLSIECLLRVYLELSRSVDNASIHHLNRSHTSSRSAAHITQA